MLGPGKGQSGAMLGPGKGQSGAVLGPGKSGKICQPAAQEKLIKIQAITTAQHAHKHTYKNTHTHTQIQTHAHTLACTQTRTLRPTHPHRYKKILQTAF